MFDFDFSICAVIECSSISPVVRKIDLFWNRLVTHIKHSPQESMFHNCRIGVGHATFVFSSRQWIDITCLLEYAYALEWRDPCEAFGYLHEIIVGSRIDEALLKTIKKITEFMCLCMCFLFFYVAQETLLEENDRGGSQAVLYGGCPLDRYF